jgi:hypothetical protein
METSVSFSAEQLAVVRHFGEAIEEAPEGRDPTILARDDGYDPSTLTGIVGEQGLSRQLGLLPEQAVLKFKGTVPIHGDAEFKLGQRFQCTVECVVSGDATKGKVEDGELVEPGKTQEAIVLEARR